MLLLCYTVLLKFQDNSFFGSIALFISCLYLWFVWLLGARRLVGAQKEFFVAILFTLGISVAPFSLVQTNISVPVIMVVFPGVFTRMD